MGQYNIYAADDELNIDVNVEPLTLDTLENSKTAAEASAETARQCAETATEALNDITDYKNSLELYYAQASDNLTTLLNNSLASLNFCKQGIQTLGNTVLSSINSAYNSIVEYIQTLGQGYVNQAKYYADEARDTVDNRVSLEHLNQSKALETGDVSDDSAVLHQLNRFACSTFDNTKFTVVGSPVITDDGIISYWNNSNKITYGTINGNGSINYEIHYRLLTPQHIYTSDNTYTQPLYLSNSGDKPWTLQLYTQNQRALMVHNGGYNYIGLGALSSNIDYIDLIIKNNGVEFSVSSYKSDGSLLKKEISTNSASDMPFESLTLYTNNNSYFTTGTPLYQIDTKYLKAVIDGVPVFSGNKTGIDTIKPDDYTVVGSPTISADGVASGFSSSNYLKKSLDLSGCTSLKIEFSDIYVPNVATDRHKAFFELQPTSSTFVYGLRLYKDAALNGSLYILYPNGSGGATFVNLSSGTGTTTNFSGYIEIKNKVLTVFVNNVTAGTFNLSDAQLEYIFTSTTLSIGATTHSSAEQFLSEGTIDLNAVKVYIDGNLVYQPCLKIPFTLSKTGSKIVDSVYRDRVDYMYEQFGYAPYYTLSDSDFTLPMGELYGMIENLRKLIIDRTTQAGV